MPELALENPGSSDPGAAVKLGQVDGQGRRLRFYRDLGAAVYRGFLADTTKEREPLDGRPSGYSTRSTQHKRGPAMREKDDLVYAWSQH